MDIFEELSSEIIDDVIDAILEHNPEMDTTGKQGDTLLYGEAYYDLKSGIANMIRSFVTERGGGTKCVSNHNQG